MASQKNWQAARPYLQTAYDAGCRDVLCLRWLAITQFACGDFGAAEPVLRQWLAVSPGNSEASKYLHSIATRDRTGARMHSSSGTMLRNEPDRQLRIDLPGRAMSGDRPSQRVEGSAAARLNPVAGK